MTLAPGSVWIIPASEQIGSILPSNISRFCEIVVPVKGPDLELVEFHLEVNIRDGLLYAASKVFERQATNNFTSKKSAPFLIEAVQWHVIERYDINPRRRGVISRRFSPDAETYIISYLNDRIASRITLEELANVATADVHVMLNKFYASFGMTPVQYITHLRVERAKSLLLSSSCGVSEISAAVGFRHPSQFKSIFIKSVGIAPIAFRQFHDTTLNQRRR